MPSSRWSSRQTPRQNHEDLSQRERLKATAKQTLQTLPDLLEELGTRRDAHRAIKYSFESLTRHHPGHCPFYSQPATIRVVRDDTLNAAINLLQSVNDDDDGRSNLRPAVVNFANRHTPGGGWLKGAMAQEEALCYRSSLALSLNAKQHYPLATNEALYSPYVVIIREDLASGHRLPDIPARNLPVVSVLTVAAIHQPQTVTFHFSQTTDRNTENGDDNNGNDKSGDEESGGDGNGSNENGDKVRMSDSKPKRLEKCVFARDKDRDLTKAKMRLALRMAVHHDHRLLVLGALGCGVYGNPPEDIAHCWLEVLREDEFSGNWWREVCFAVYDPNDEGNFDVFDRVLSGKQV